MDEAADGSQQPNSAVSCGHTDDLSNSDGGSVGAGVPAFRARLCLVGRLSLDPSAGRAAAALGLPVLLHESAEEALADCAPRTYYVLEEFAGPAFDMLYKAKQSILGPTALQQLSVQPDCQLPEINRPLYCLSMKAAVICFTGFRVKEELTHLITLIHHMGGSIRKDMSARVTHLIANCCGGEKYRYATAFRVPVVSRTWVDYCWEQRAQVDCRAADEAIVSQHKLKVFLGARVCFIGFPEEEHQHMTDILLKNGGETAALEDTNCSHVVVANGGMYDRSIPFSPTPNPTPDNTADGADENTFSELMKLLSPQIKHVARKSVDLSPSLRGTTHIAPMNGEELSDSKFSSYKLETMSPDGLKRLSEHMLLEKSDNNDSFANGCHDNNEYNHINNGEDDIKKLKRRPIVDINESLLNVSDASNTVSSHCLLRLFSPEKDNIILPSMGSGTNISISTTASSKKRSRNSAESNFDLELPNGETPNKAVEENNWKSPFKRLKIKDSFRFKGKEKPVICKTLKKKKSKNDDTNHDEDDKNNLTDYIIQTSTPSPRKDDDNISMCSISSTAKADRSFFSSSGLFDISFCSLRSGKTAKSVSKIRRSMKSLTASFRGERKKKYEKRAKDSESEDDEFEEKNKIIDTIKKSPKTTKNAPVATSVILDISPVENKTPLARISEYNELEGSNSQFQSSPLIFKTPMGKPKRQATPKATVVSPYTTFSPNPGGARALAPKPDQSRARRHPGKQDRANNVLNRSLLSVVDEQHTQSLPEANATAHVVKAEWFWASVQNEEAQDEKDYLFEDYLEAQASPSRRSSRGSLSSSASCAGRTSPPPGAPTPSSTPRPSGLSGQGPKGRRKRKLRGPEAALHKRRSSVGDAVLLSLSGNLLDCTQSPDGKQSLLDEVECVSVSDAARKLMSPRQQVFMELLQTESNYVGILHTIVTMFKQPLEEMSDEDNGTTNPLLNNTELKIIFGNLPPIYEIHRRMLEELKWASYNWSEETSIGRIVYKYAQDLVKAYPPFVNFFENMKDMLVQCDREKPRFHAFLKICQTKPECGRQSLQELLIRPVQRLPSISLLLDDILKHTSKSNPDHSALEAALAGVREVMAHVNEDKRKTEGQLQMFDIYNEIDNCPAHLVSSHRSFVSRCEVVEISKDLSGRGDHLVLFLFTDVMEVCKKRSKVFNSKSPPVNGLHHAASRLGSGKPYRHVQLMPLSTVKRVIDIRESNECHKVFALMCRSNQELKEKLYSFAITDESVDKTHFLKQLCRQMANTVCKADAEKFLACLDSHQLDIDTSDIALGTLSKAFKFASRTRLKVGRAFSFNKTPSKLKRAMSSMISPFGSTSNLTPASQLAQMRLASCNNINEAPHTLFSTQVRPVLELGSHLWAGAPKYLTSLLDSVQKGAIRLVNSALLTDSPQSLEHRQKELGVTGGSNVPEVLVAPLSVQPTRKAKTASLSAGALRRL